VSRVPACSRQRLPFLLALGAACAMFAAGAPAAPPGGPHFLGPTLQHPQRAPGFALRDQHDRLVSLAGLRGKVVLLTFPYTRHVEMLAVSVDPSATRPPRCGRSCAPTGCCRGSTT